jgi:hypothetical protein
MFIPNEEVDKIPKEYSLIDGVVNMLKILKANGYLLAVVSNWRDQSLKSDMEPLGISSYFDYIADSSVEGVTNPDPAIFNNETIHIGELMKMTGRRSLSSRQNRVKRKNTTLPTSRPIATYLLPSLVNILILRLRCIFHTKFCPSMGNRVPR